MRDASDAGAASCSHDCLDLGVVEGDGARGLEVLLGREPLGYSLGGLLLSPARGIGNSLLGFLLGLALLSCLLRRGLLG